MKKFAIQLTNDQALFDSFFNKWAKKFLGKWPSKNRLDLEKANEKWDSFKEHKKLEDQKHLKEKEVGKRMLENE